MDNNTCVNTGFPECRRKRTTTRGSHCRISSSIISSTRTEASSVNVLSLWITKFVQAGVNGVQLSRALSVKGSCETGCWGFEFFVIFIISDEPAFENTQNRDTLSAICMMLHIIDSLGVHFTHVTIYGCPGDGMQDRPWKHSCMQSSSGHSVVLFSTSTNSTSVIWCLVPFHMRIKLQLIHAILTWRKFNLQNGKFRHSKLRNWFIS